MVISERSAPRHLDRRSHCRRPRPRLDRLPVYVRLVRYGVLPYDPDLSDHRIPYAELEPAAPGDCPPNTANHARRIL